MTTRWAWIAAAAWAACATSGAAHAASTYRCTDGAGRITLSDHACPVDQPAAPPCRPAG